MQEKEALMHCNPTRRTFLKGTAATAALEQCGYHHKIAIVMLLCGCTAEEAEKRLAEKDGYIARVVG